MKIAYLTQYAVDGQTQSQFYNYSRLIDKEFDVNVFYLFQYDNNELIKAYENNGVRVESLEFQNPRISFKNFIKFVKIMSKMDVDIIHSQHPIAGFYNKLGTTFVNIFYRKKIKIIVEQRCVKKNLSFFARILETITHPLADLVICSSDSVELSYFNKVNYLPDFLENKRIKHITFYNSIDTSLLKKHQQKEVCDLKNKDVVTICMVGRNEPVKQPLLVLQAINILKNYNVMLYVAGHGSLDEQMKKYVKENELENTVTFLGNITWVPKLLSESDIYINYSKHEGLCKSLLEAMAMGTAVIASKVEGNIEVVGLNNEYGILADSTSDVKLAEAIVNLIEKFELYKKYSEVGKGRVKKFDVEYQIKEIENIYKKFRDEA